MTTDNFCFYLHNSLIQTSQTRGQWYNDTSPFSIPWFHSLTLKEDETRTEILSDVKCFMPYFERKTFERDCSGMCKA